ncbi:MAG TPA: kelch repeat-containing protein [Chthoniobacterales bacterium]|jgi:hypothetical protein
MKNIIPKSIRIQSIRRSPASGRGAAGLPPAGGTAWRRVVLPLICLTAALLAQPCVATPFAWEYTASLHDARLGHTATLLSDGRVLVAGGGGSTGLLASAELYDPATQTWTLTGSLNTARSAHTATLLANGKVLVAGGFDSSGALASAELYDPMTGAWSTTGSLSTGRVRHTATLLLNGTVLVAGGNDLSLLPYSELYDPSLGSWHIAGNFRRYSHTATLLENGNVLVAGGKVPSVWLNSTKLFDPATNLWTLTGRLNTERDGHTATLLPGGKVLVAGGFRHPGFSLRRAELYDPATGMWVDTRRLKASREQHTATLLADGTVLVAGGQYLDGSYLTLASAELYYPASEHWTFTGSLNTGRYNHTATLLANGQVLVTGGTFGGYPYPALASSELYDPGTPATNMSGSGSVANQGK